MIIATAGHVDHGKTSLVRRLTGIDTDRLPEERKRGMTIDLGFAYVDAFGTRVGFVDVPGHERFVHNMLVGASGIDMALVVVAADDGVMPQTQEHLQILEVLGVTTALVALTKVDRATPARVEEVRADVAGLLGGTAMAGATIVEVSSVTGEGIDALRAHLQAVAARLSQARDTSTLFRLAIDRAFTIAGTGTVVTGFVRSGECAVGDELLAWPLGERVRVRGIHANDREVAHVRAGERAAIALAGLERSQCARGGWLLHPDCGPATQRAVVQLHPHTFLPAHRDWLRVHLHLASNHVLARLHAWQDDAGRRLAELRLDEPVPMIHGDRFVLRDESAQRTLGGGSVMDPQPPARGLLRPDYQASLQLLHAPTAIAALEHAQAHGMVVPLEAFRRTWNTSPSALTHALETTGMARIAHAGAHLGIGAATLQAHADVITDTVGTWHKANPHVRGIRPDQLRTVLRARMPPQLVAPICEHMIHTGALHRSAGFLQRPGHAPRISPEDRQLWERIAPLLGADVRPPVLHDLSRRLQVDIESLRTAMRRLAFAGLIVQVADNRFFPAAQVDALMQTARELDAEDGGQGFLATRFRDATALGRNLAIEVLEYFDGIGFTVRRGDRRILSRVHAQRTQRAVAGGARQGGSKAADGTQA